MKRTVPKCMLEAELCQQICQIRSFMNQVADVDKTAQHEIATALEHLYRARKLLNLENVN